MRNTLPASLPRPAAERHVEALEDHLAEARRRRGPSGISTAVSEPLYSAGFGAEDLEPPGAHGAARGFGVARVAREHVLEPFLASIASASRRP